MTAVAAMVASPAYAVDYLSVEKAQSVLFPDAVTFVPDFLKLTEEQKDKIKSMAGTRQRWDEQKVWKAEKNGKLQGWFIVDDVVGKHEFITYATAISPDGHVLGVEILSYRETHGSQIRDAAWRQHFTGKTLSDSFKLDEDVPNISGATLSSRNVLDGVKRLLVIRQLFLAQAK
jgi:Na+-translocating ferredoxin:NAD+ oxidoreductase RnfG subunit